MLEQQNAARAGQMASMQSIGSALMSGGNVLNAQAQPRGLTSMSPAPQQLSSRPRKILLAVFLVGSGTFGRRTIKRRDIRPTDKLPKRHLEHLAYACLVYCYLTD